jgi:hypothetical protein
MNDIKMHSRLKKKEKILMNISFSTEVHSLKDQTSPLILNHLDWNSVPLNPEFKKYLEEAIHGIIIGIPILKKEYPKFKNDWKFSNEFDFLYGCIVGQILGTSLTAFKMIHDREAKSDEILSIGELIESYFPLIRDEIQNAP